MKTKLVVGAAAGAVGGALIYGSRRWRVATKASVARLRHSAAPSRSVYQETELDPLPAPAQRYFGRVLRAGQPVVTVACVNQVGKFRMGESPESWRPMATTQLFCPNAPGFVWDAKICLIPGLTVRVRDAYVEGAGAMHAEVLSLFPVVHAEGTPELAAAALQRYLAEAAWFPTALLPSQGVQWTPVSGSAARASLSDRSTTVSLEFRFGPDGEILSAFTPARYREVKGAYLPTPWECRYSDYAERDGMRIPLEGEAAWQLPDRSFPYWRGRISAIAYTWAGARLPPST